MAKIPKPASKAKGTKGNPVQQTTENLASEELAALNFKVSPSFKREFKTYATQQDISMRELLEKAFYQYRDAN